ncbi:MAG: hypothetical protein DME98_11765 [Verrucomicrobia bacterium]|nr:MAG: hypothetical protein DME98_11765 [Verrucomicrobiota bacterium]PYJ34998.1 MAG: hypothetical protein DME88_03140 [Verrucomicrobiota bacterium]
MSKLNHDSRSGQRPKFVQRVLHSFIGQLVDALVLRITSTLNGWCSSSKAGIKKLLCCGNLAGARTCVFRIIGG